MTEPLQARALAALARIQNPRLGSDLFSAGMIRDLTVDDTGRIAFTFLLGKEDPATLVREARAALRGLEGAGEVKITVKDPAGPPAEKHGPPGAPQSAAAGVPAQQPISQPHLGRILAVSSGKGGVGKSTVAVNLAIALAQMGHRVGVMDADVHGPNIPRMFGVNERPMVDKERQLMIPLEAHGVKLMSLGFMIERDQAAIWRGPIIMKVVQQFLRDVDWGTLDYFLVDMPPGTGDAQLSLVQSTKVTAALIVTTPQEVAVGDALRGAKMFERVGVPVIGVVENMAAFVDPESGKRWAMFSEGGGERLAIEAGAPFLGSIPLQPFLADNADKGLPIVVAAPGSPAAKVLLEVAEKVQELLGARRELPVVG